MVIKTYPLGIYEENIYVLVDEKSREIGRASCRERV